MSEHHPEVLEKIFAEFLDDDEMHSLYSKDVHAIPFERAARIIADSRKRIAELEQLVADLRLENAEVMFDLHEVCYGTLEPPGPGRMAEAKLKRIEENERLRERCDYFDIAKALLSGQRLAVRVRWLDEDSKT